jgi:UDP-glucose-4-epimerase GalE
MADKVLVTGGAGYIGSHTVRALRSVGYEPIVFDNLYRGHREAVLDARLIVGDLLNREDLREALRGQDFKAVVHFAAMTYVGESVSHPDVYYRNNVVGTLNLLDAMREEGVPAIIFSSTAATYGNPLTTPMNEDHPQNPVNPYGCSKLMVEHLLRDYDAAFGLRSVALRYFNAAGCSFDGEIGEDHEPETHLIPRVLMAITGEIPKVTILGTDYDTPDGTCVRDFIHVEDLAEAHVLGLKHLLEGGKSTALNLGTSQGYSVREVITCVEKVTGKTVPAEEGPRRAGDPPSLVADARRGSEVLNWKPQHRELEAIVESAWRWQQKGGRYALLRK